MSNELREGVRLRQVVCLPDPNEGTAVYTVDSHDVESITVSGQTGHMAMVPWAKVVFSKDSKWNPGSVVLVNLANVESVVLEPEETTDEGF